MKIQILDRTKKKKFIEALSELGIEKIPELLVRSGAERIRAFSGDLSTEQIMDLWRLLPIEGVGLYVGKEIVNRRTGTKETRLTIDGLHMLKSNNKKLGSERTIILTEKQEVEWFLGRDIELEESQKLFDGFVCVKSSDGLDFVGVGKVGDNGKVLFSFLPKERRRKERMG